MAYFDKNGDKVSIGDLVLLDVFEVKLHHESIVQMIGKIIFYDYDYHTFLIDLGTNELQKRHRKWDRIELANCLQEEFQEQIAEYDRNFMLWKLENAS